MRRLLAYEWGKLFHLPALWVFLGLCLAFNGLLLIASISPYDRAFFNETSRTAKALGQRVDEDFLAGLDAMPATENGTCCSSPSPAWRISSRHTTPKSFQTSMPAWWKNRPWL